MFTDDNAHAEGNCADRGRHFLAGGKAAVLRSAHPQPPRIAGIAPFGDVAV